MPWLQYINFYFCVQSNNIITLVLNLSFLQAPNLPNPEFIEDMFLLPRSKAKQVCLNYY